MDIAITFQQILGILFVIYLIIVVGVIVLDNRTTQSTFAWLFLMFTFPILGFIIYIMFGRNYKAFSNEGKLARVGVGGLSKKAIEPLLDAQKNYVEKVRLEKPELYRQKLLSLVQRNQTHSHC